MTGVLPSEAGLAAGTFEEDLVRKEVALDAEVTATGRTAVPATLARRRPGLLRLRCRPLWFMSSHSDDVVVGVRVFPRPAARTDGKRRQTGETRVRVCVFPGDVLPVPEGKEVMVGPGEVGAEDEGECAAGTLGGQGADHAAAPGTVVAPVPQLTVAGTQGRGLLRRPSSGGKPDHDEGVVGAVVLRGRGRRGRGEHEEFLEVVFVQDDAVALDAALVRALDDLLADGETGGESDDADADGVGHETLDGGVDVARVGGHETPVDHEDLTGAVGGDVEEGGPGHLEGVLEGGVAFALLLLPGLEGGDVVLWVAAEGGDRDGDAVEHADDGELGDWVLLKVLVHKVAGVIHAQLDPRGSQVLLGHGDAKVEDEDEVTDDAPLHGGRVLEQASSLAGLDDALHGRGDGSRGVLLDGVPGPLVVCRPGIAPVLRRHGVGRLLLATAGGGMLDCAHRLVHREIVLGLSLQVVLRVRHAS